MARRIGLKATTVDTDHRDAVGHRVAALDGHPGVTLAQAFVVAIARIPAYGGGIDEQVRTGQGHEARGFGIPLVPTDQHPELAHRGGDGGEAQVARREIELFVKAGIVRNVHLAVQARDAAVAFQHHRRVVAQARCAAFKKRNHQHHAQLFGQGGKKSGRWSGYGFREIKGGDVFGLTEIRAGVQFLQAHQARSLAGRRANAGRRGGQHRFAMAGITLLHQSDAQAFHVQTSSGICMVMQCSEPCCSISTEQSMPSTAKPGQAVATAARAA